MSYNPMGYGRGSRNPSPANGKAGTSREAKGKRLLETLLNLTPLKAVKVVLSLTQWRLCCHQNRRTRAY